MLIQHNFSYISATNYVFPKLLLPVCNTSLWLLTHITVIETVISSERGMYHFNPFPNKPCFFTSLQYKSFENTVGKGEIARDEQFLLFPQCFLPICETFLPFSSN